MAMPNDAGEHTGEPAAAASDIPVVAAPPLDPAAPQAASIAGDGASGEPTRAEPAKVEAPEAPAAKPPPIMPRAAILSLPPDDKPGVTASAAATAGPAAAPASPGAGGSRFPLLAAGIALAAAVGAIAGSAGTTGVQHMFVAPPVATTRSEANEEARILKDAVVQLRANVKTLSDNLSALRTTITTSNVAANAQFTKIAETLDRVERSRVERHVTTLTPSPEPTGSVPASAPGGIDPKTALKLPIIDGWSLRKVYSGEAALIEGRRGIVEIGPGDVVPGLGLIQEIRRQDGRWVVVTPRGLIVSSR